MGTHARNLRVRHYNCQPEPEPLLRLVDGPSAADLARIGAVIRATRHKRTCGSYLFISPALDVYVLSEEAVAAVKWVKERLPWLVALYCPGTVTLCTPAGLGPTVDMDLEGLAEDIAEHLAELQGRAP